MEGRVFLIDSENISDYSFIKMNNVSCHDEVVIFASKVSKSIRMGCLEHIIESKAKISFEWVETGSKNELDFQLVAHLGMFLDLNKAHYIVSRDCGFASAVKHIKKKNPKAVIEIIRENQRIKQNGKHKSTGSQSKGDISKEIDVLLEVLKSEKLRKKVKSVIESWLKGLQTGTQAEKNISLELRRFGLNGKVNENLCKQIVKPAKQLIESEKIA